MMICKSCGRPKGTSKAWRPDPRPEGWRTCNKCVYVESNPHAVPDGISASGATEMGVPSIDVKAALAALMAEAEPVSTQSGNATAPVSTEAAPAPVTMTAPTGPVEAQEVAPQPPFSAATAPSGSVPRMVAGLGRTLPEHSPLGGSAAKRYLSCSGSVALMGQLRGNGDGQDEQEEWTAEGSLGHLLGAHCLEKGHDPMLYIAGREQWEAVNEDLACAVQEYVDYVHSRPGQMLVEYKAHRPELHQWMYGAIDCVKYGVNDPFLEIIDLKLGAGVVVDVEENDQLRYYACLYIMADPADWPDDTPVHLTIVQPRAAHGGGKIRTWTTTVGDLKRWLYEVLLPGMQRTAEIQGLFLDMGEHCQFCPAKIACPAMGNLVRKALIDATLHITGTETAPIASPGWKPVINGDEMKLLKMLISAYGKWSFSQLQAGAAPEFVGMKMVFGKADRVWKDGAEEAAKPLGEAAYTKPELQSPAQLEKLPGGAAIVAEYAYTPDGKLTVAPLSDPRPAVMGKSASALFGRHIQKALAEGA